MAGIEKVCEYSGEHPGWDMYGYKYNHIQIMPEYRKLFRGKKATLIFFDTSYTAKSPYYEYALVVPELPGRVNGVYMNWSYNKGTVIRKLKRLIGRNLVIEKSQLTYEQWCMEEGC